MSESIRDMPTAVWYDGGKDGRVMVADSLSYFEHEPWVNDVVLGASFAGAATAAMPMRPGVKGWIAHEGGPGKDEAGVSGLWLADQFGIPAAAVATMEAGLSNGRSLLTGRISRANKTAEALGVEVGMSGGEAGKLMLKAPLGRALNLSGLVDEQMHTVHAVAGGKIYAVWSFSRVQGQYPNDVFCVASHGGRVMAQYALRVRPKGLIANDAGGGLHDSGRSGLDAVQEVCGVPAATVSTETARIGDALSTYHDGVISAVNGNAARLGVSAGMLAKEAAALLLRA